MNEKIELPWRIFQNINSFITSADTKASGLIAAEGVILGVTLDNLTDIKTSLLLSWAYIPALVAAVFFLVSLYFAMRCLTPRLRINYPVGLPSVIYFQSIASMDYDRFADGIDRGIREEAHAVEQINRQAWINSHIATAKFADIKCALRFLQAGVAFAILAMIKVSI